MRNRPTKKVMSYLAPSLITTSLFVSITASAMPQQSALSATSKIDKETVVVAKTGTADLKRNLVLARNTTARPSSITATSTVQKSQDKKALSRCWKRLMTMVREVSHAHRASTDQ